MKQFNLAHCTLSSQCLQDNDVNWARESFNLFLCFFCFVFFFHHCLFGKVLQEVLCGWKEKKNYSGVIFLRLQGSFCIGECIEPMGSDRGDFRIARGVQA